MAGDSTMADYKKYSFPQMGWGQKMSDYFQSTVTIHNHAVNGRSTKSFIDENRWKEMEKQFQPGGYVIIQFGHNDQKEDKERATEPFTTYQQNLRHFIQRTRQFNVTPILATSIARRRFDVEGNLEDTHGDYPKAMRDLAREENITLIDMLKLTEQAIKQLGPEQSKQWFMWSKPDEYEAFPNGAKDDTHLNEMGASKVAGLFVRELRKLEHPLANYLKMTMEG
nr:rhamnogalacturonan acetylesterase [Gracilibacillus halotolerans]